MEKLFSLKWDAIIRQNSLLPLFNVIQSLIEYQLFHCYNYLIYRTIHPIERKFKTRVTSIVYTEENENSNFLGQRIIAYQMHDQSDNALLFLLKFHLEISIYFARTQHIQ